MANVENKRMARPSLLLVDDDPGAIALLGSILSSVGVLRFATNGKDALRLIRETAPDLILLDAEIPDLNGFELLRLLGGDSRFADIPVIVVTSHTEAGFEVSALELGAADFIAKPFRSSLVMARVQSQLRRKHRAEELARASAARCERCARSYSGAY